MNLTTLLKLASTRLDARRGGVSTSDLAFAEIDRDGKLVTVNPLAGMKWGWTKGAQVRDEMRIALEGLAGSSPTELPLKIGGMHIGAIVREKDGGWLVFGYNPESIGPNPQAPDEETSFDAEAATDHEAVSEEDDSTVSLQPEEDGFTHLFRRSSGRRPRTTTVQAAVNTLRLLATTTPDRAAFCDSAMQTMAGALEADEVLYFVRNGNGGLVLAASFTSRYERGETASGLSDDHPVFRLVDARGSATEINRAIAPVICKQFNFTDGLLAAVRDQDRVVGYVLATLPGSLEAGKAETLPGQLDQLVSTFSSLYTWIDLIGRHREMLSAIEDVVFTFEVSPDGGRHYCHLSDRFESFFGFHPEEVTRVDSSRLGWIDRLVHEEDRDLVRQKTRTLLSDGEATVDYRIRHRNGSIRWVRERAWMQKDYRGLHRATGILKDVSEVKAVEAMVEDARREAESARRSRTAFSATLSHEVRTPLGALSGYAQLLEKELSEFEETSGHILPEQVHEFVSVLTNRSSKLQRVVHDLFELSNLEMGNLALNRAVVPLNALVQEAADRAAPALESKELELIVRLGDGRLSVLADERSLGQILDNVLSNAMKFTDQGQVVVRTRGENGFAVVEIEDTGIGISAEYQCELFEAFSQEENWRNRRFGGTGLGLALSRRLVDLLDGRIEVESEKGAGSVFRIYLPLAD